MRALAAARATPQARGRSAATMRAVKRAVRARRSRPERGPLFSFLGSEGGPTDAPSGRHRPLGMLRETSQKKQKNALGGLQCRVVPPPHEQLDRAQGRAQGPTQGRLVAQLVPSAMRPPICDPRARFFSSYLGAHADGGRRGAVPMRRCLAKGGTASPTPQLGVPSWPLRRSPSAMPRKGAMPPLGPRSRARRERPRRGDRLWLGTD